MSSRRACTAPTPIRWVVARLARAMRSRRGGCELPVNATSRLVMSTNWVLGRSRFECRRERTSARAAESGRGVRRRNGMSHFGSWNLEVGLRMGGRESGAGRFRKQLARRVPRLERAREGKALSIRPPAGIDGERDLCVGVGDQAVDGGEDGSTRSASVPGSRPRAPGRRASPDRPTGRARTRPRSRSGSDQTGRPRESNRLPTPFRAPRTD